MASPEIPWGQHSFTVYRSRRSQGGRDCLGFADWWGHHHRASTNYECALPFSWLDSPAGVRASKGNAN